MNKLLARWSVVALVATAALYGCGRDSDSPTAPTVDFGLSRSALFQVPVCGEVSYLAELSTLLPVWRDSIQTWLPAATLNETPVWTGPPVADYLAQLVPALQQWQGAVNAAAGSDLFAPVPAFDSDTTKTQVYLVQLAALLTGWETAAETARGTNFLPTPPAFVPDTFAPAIACPADTSFACADTAGVVLVFEVAAEDDCDPAPVVVSVPPSGSTFRSGTTAVTTTATDASGNVSTCTFNVTVGVDDAPPVLACPGDTTITCASPDGIAYAFNVSATDACDGTPVIVSEPASGSVFPVGTTTVTATATDTAGNSSTCSFDVTVEAATVTIRSVEANPGVLWPPNHKLVNVGFDLDLENECDVDVNCRVVEVISNEPVNGKGDGNSAPDWVIGVDGSLKLRAERSGGGSGRVYTVRVRCEDASGVGEDATVRVFVPHDQGGGGLTN